jgi:hypothetical protein
LLGAKAQIAAPQHNEALAHCPRFLVPQPNGKQQNAGHQLRDSFGVESRFETGRSSSAFNFFGLDSKFSRMFD